MVIKSNNVLWDEYFERLPSHRQDIYFTRQYCLSDEKLNGGEAQLFVYEKDNNFVLYPYIRRPVPDNSLDQKYYDIETPYGYGGPAAGKDDPAFIHDFEEAFLEHCRKENIIAEFIRFHPLLKNHSLFKKNIEVLHNRITVWLDLDKSLDEIWMHDIASQNRNVIRKCEKNGLIVELSHDYAEFEEIYNQTMERVGAGEFYFFSRQYYDEIKENPNYTLMRVRRSNEVLACAVFMRCGQYFHYHLSGSRREFLKLSPNNILLWRAIQYAKETGCKKMHFGGGLTDSTEDSLFRFKSRFSKTYTDFYIGKRIHDQKIYSKLIQKWEEIHGEKAKILLQYRD